MMDSLSDQTPSMRRFDSNTDSRSGISEYNADDLFDFEEGQLPLVLYDEENKSMEKKLLDLTLKTRYNLIQRNGQRIYGGPPPGWTGPPPGLGTEIFVGKVPRNCYEYELVPIFEKIGQIYELRLMMDFSGSNRGYLFVRYTTVEDAKRAVRELNNYEIRPGKFIGVTKSVDNRTLWISGIPKNKTALEIQTGLEQITEGIRKVFTDATKNRDCAFVEYESHRAAAMARRRLVPLKNTLCGQEIRKVDWAEPKRDLDKETSPNLITPCRTKILSQGTLVNAMFNPVVTQPMMNMMFLDPYQHYSRYRVTGVHGDLPPRQIYHGYGY